MTFVGKTLLITGGTGTFGKAVLRRFLANFDARRGPEFLQPMLDSIHHDPPESGQ